MTSHDSDRPLTSIAKDIGDDLGRLVRSELALLKTEMRENATRIGTGAGLLGGAGVIGLFALQFLLLALVFGLAALGLTLWLSALIVAVVLGVVAGVMAARGKKDISSAHVAPEETIQQVKTDADVIKDDVARLRRK